MPVVFVSADISKSVKGKAPDGTVRVVVGSEKQTKQLATAAGGVARKEVAGQVEKQLKTAEKEDGSGATPAGTGTSFIASKAVQEGDINDSVGLGNLMAHEVGHILGGQHTDTENELMNPQVPDTEDAEFKKKNETRINRGLLRRSESVMP